MEEALKKCFAFGKLKDSIIVHKDKNNMEEQLKRDMVEFSLWLANADKKIDRQELVTIGRTLGITLDDDFKILMEKVKENGDKYLDKIPLSIDYFAQVDKIENPNSEWLTSARFLYKTFKKMGCIIIACNGCHLSVEVDALNRFCDKIIQYIIEIEQKDTCMDFVKQKAIQKQKKEETEDLMEKTNTILEEVNSLIGLENVKHEISNLVNLLLVYRYRADRGLKNPPLAMHFVFTGNPGTGKTTIARKLADIYKELGLITTGQLVEVDRSALVAGYVGQTAEKVNEVVERAMGGVLFIDEAYSLVSNSENDFGQEAIDVLLKKIEDNRDKFVTIVAGYPKEMEEFLESNPGLRSRFNRSIRFDDYSVEELMSIFERMCGEYDYQIAENAKLTLISRLEQMVLKPNFANARDVRNYFEQVVNHHANRMMQIGLSDSAQLQTIDEQDL